MWIKFWGLPPDDYLMRIGRLVATMSYVEAYLKQLLWQSLDIGPERGSLMTGGARLSDVTAMLNDWVDRHETNQLIVDDIADVIKEANELKRQRDLMAHRQWDVKFDPGIPIHDGNRAELAKVRLVHEVLAKKADLAQVTHFTIPEMDDLCNRATYLVGRLLRLLLRNADPGQKAVRMIDMNWNYALPPAPWLGRSSPREEKAGNSRNDRKQSPQP